MPKKVKKPTVEEAVEGLKKKVTRLKKRLAVTKDDIAKRAARKRVKRAQRRKRALAPPAPKAAT